MHGFFGKLLRIDLSAKSIKTEDIPDEVLQTYLGGKGLAVYLLQKYLPAGVDPLSPENILIFATGPATGTTIPAAGRYGVFAKSPQTGFLGEAYSGGHTSPAMKRTGYDAFMIEGAAKEPVYLHISDQGIEFGNASELWGKESYETEDALIQIAGASGAQAVVIGPAGENMVSYACIKNNYWRSAGRTGMGAVMGSKKLKGVVFSGTSKASLADENALNDFVTNMIRTYKDTERTSILRTKGTPYMVATANEASIFPTRYWKESSYEGWRGISSDAMWEKMDVKPNACYRCFCACGKICTVKSGRHKGLTIEGPEYETLYSLGGLLCIDQIEEVAYLNDLCDRMGLDTITLGNVISFAIEAGKRGKLEDMPDYGDVDAVASLIRQIALKEGVGKLLSRGVKEVSRELGLEELAIHVKGLEPAGYDPRALPGMGLGYAVSSRGACHLRSSFYMVELRGEVPIDMVEGKAKYFIKNENKNTLEDTLILCRFYYQFIGPEGMEKIIKATTGLDFSQDDLSALASRITTMTRRFNIREGLTRADDILPDRFFNEPIGPDKNIVLNREDIDTMTLEYYTLQGWDENGIPKDD
jgi:aldehyde:ferredoxin oxidoreductase